MDHRFFTVLSRRKICKRGNAIAGPFDPVQNGREQIVVSAGRGNSNSTQRYGRTLWLFDLKSGQNRKLLSDTTGSDMDGLTFDGDWIAWKTGTNYPGSYRTLQPADR